MKSTNILALEYQEVKEQLKQLEARKKEIEDEILNMIEGEFPHEGIRYIGPWKIDFRTKVELVVPRVERLIREHPEYDTVYNKRWTASKRDLLKALNQAPKSLQKEIRETFSLIPIKPLVSVDRDK